MSRKDAEAYCGMSHGNRRVAVIGVSSIGGLPSPAYATPSNGVVGVLGLAFGDEEKPWAPGAFTRAQAEAIARFVARHAGTVDAFIVHADEREGANGTDGRAAGIAVSILDATGGNGKDILRYRPNELVQELCTFAIAGHMDAGEQERTKTEWERT